jgi:hypothetical protein
MANAPGAVAAALRPIAAIKATYGAGGTVTLNGSGSAAACNHTLTGPSSYQWTSSDPTGHPVSAASGTSTTVTAPASGTLSIMLSVTDELGRTDSATVQLSSTKATSSSPTAAGSHACLAAMTIASPIVVTISPASASLQAGAASVPFTASVTDALNTAINWEVNGVTGGNATVGTISSAGLYTPPTTLASSTVMTVSAVSAADPTRMASAQVTVTAPPPPAGSSSGGTTGGGSGGGQTGGSAANAVGSGGSGGGGGAADELTLALAALLVLLRSSGARWRAPRRR